MSNQIQPRIPDFICEGKNSIGVDPDWQADCIVPCYLACAAADTFDYSDMNCIFGYSADWQPITRELNS